MATIPTTRLLHIEMFDGLAPGEKGPPLPGSFNLPPFDAHIMGPVEEAINFTWAPLLEGGDMNLFNKIIKALGGKFDKKFESYQVAIPPSMTILLGGYPSLPSFNINFRLYCEEDPIAEVHQPLLNLKKMVTPNFTRSVTYMRRLVEISVGKFLFISPAVITGVADTYSETIIHDVPGYIDGSVAFSPQAVWEEKDLDAVYTAVKTTR